jgi:hypothetical protein
MAVALLALFVALGGTGYAAARINGRTITDRSISGAKLKRNTLTGRQIDESRLGRVPSAADSDFLNGRPASAYLLADGGVAASARNALLLDGASAAAFLPVGGKATDADRLDGLDSSAFAPAGKVQGAVALTVGADQTLLSSGGLTVLAHCAAGPRAQVLLRHAVPVLDPTATGPANVVPAGDTALADATYTGAGDAVVARAPFTALADGGAVQGVATAIATASGCEAAAFGVTG